MSATKARFAQNAQTKKRDGCLAVRRSSVRHAVASVAIVSAIRPPVMKLKFEY